MNLVYFTKDAYKSLKKDLDANKEKYFSDDPWLDQYFSEAGITEYFKKSTIVVPNVSLAHTGDDDVSKKNDDLTNTRILYGAFRGKLTPLQASDPLLWSGLCHLVPEFRKYILQNIIIYNIAKKANAAYIVIFKVIFIFFSFVFIVYSFHSLFFLLTILHLLFFHCSKML